VHVRTGYESFTMHESYVTSIFESDLVYAWANYLMHTHISTATSTLMKTVFDAFKTRFHEGQFFGKCLCAVSLKDRTYSLI